MNFKELFTEKLRIIKKASDNRDEITTKGHRDEVHDAKAQMDPLLVGYIGDIKIIKSKHATEIRDYEKFARDYNVDNEMLLDIFRKLFLKPKFKPRQKTNVIYRNKKGKFDTMIVELSGKRLTIVTMIKKGVRAPYDAKASKNHKDQANVIVEGKEIIIEAEFIIS